MKKTYIITGANGFLGNNIIRLLQNIDCEIRALVHSKEKIKALENLNCKIYYGDVTKKETLNNMFDVQNAIVIHCAGDVYIKSKYSENVYNVNVLGTKNIADLCLKKNFKLIYVSSVHAIPINKNETLSEIKEFFPNKVVGWYAKTKAEASNYILDLVKEKGLDACIVQPSAIIGPNDYSNSNSNELIKNVMLEKYPVAIKGGYDFVDVRDVASGIINACYKGIKGECYILSNEYYSVSKLCNLVSEECNVKKIKIALPIWLIKPFAPLCEFYYNINNKTPLFTKCSLYTIGNNIKFSNEKAKKDLNYKTRDIRKTIKDTVNFYKNDYNS